MDISRRAMLGGAAALAAGGPAVAKAAGKGSGGDWFARAIVIDGLGGTGDPYNEEEGVTRISERAWAETVATGVTVVRDTVFPVGNLADPWGDYQKDIAAKHELIGANPDRLLLIRSAADILKAKREIGRAHV